MVPRRNGYLGSFGWMEQRHRVDYPKLSVWQATFARRGMDRAMAARRTPKGFSGLNRAVAQRRSRDRARHPCRGEQFWDSERLTTYVAYFKHKNRILDGTHIDELAFEVGVAFGDELSRDYG